MKKKEVTLLAGNEAISDEKWHWWIKLHVGRNGNIYNIGDIRAYQNRAYYLNDPEKFKQRTRDWNKENKEQKAENGARWYNANKDIIIQQSALWAAKNPKRRREISAKYARRHSGRYKARRRKLGFIPLNEKFPGANAHHVDTNYVIHIPEELHRSVSHNLKTGVGMQRMNGLAFKYLFESPKKRQVATPRGS